jgi:hypothetical protein
VYHDLMPVIVQWQHSIFCLCRIENVTEFDCFAKSFIYLSTRLPRAEFLEPFLEDATVEPVAYMKGQLNIMREAIEKNLTQCISFNVDEKLACIEQCLGGPTAAALKAVDVPLAEAEPDIFPCLLPLCGSGFAFVKVVIVIFMLSHLCFSVMTL